MSGFDDATRLRPKGPGSFEWDVPDGWQQGRGAWGGLVVGAMVRALTLLDPAPIRSVSIQMSTPAFVGAHAVEASVLRRGTSMTTWQATITSAEGVLVASMVAIVGPARSSAGESGAWGQAGAPGLPPVDEVAPLPPGLEGFPRFMERCEFRVVEGIPLSGAPARCSGWVRLRDAPAPAAAWLIGLVDAWWPASMPAFEVLRRIATVNFTANLLVDPASLDPATPLAYTASVAAAADGYTSEHRALWTPDGRLAVDNLQTIVVG